MLKIQIKNGCPAVTVSNGKAGVPRSRLQLYLTNTRRTNTDRASAVTRFAFHQIRHLSLPFRRQVRPATMHVAVAAAAAVGSYPIACVAATVAFGSLPYQD